MFKKTKNGKTIINKLRKKEIKMLFLVIMLIIVFLFLLIMSIKFKIKIENLEYNSHKHLEKNINEQNIETHYNTDYKYSK